MSINVHCQLCSIVVLIITICNFRSRRVLNIPSFKMFEKLLIAVLTSACFDMLTIIVLASGGSPNALLGAALCKIYLISITTVAYFLLHYTIYLVGKRSKSAALVQQFSLVMYFAYLVSAFFVEIDYGIMYGQVYPYGTYVGLTFTLSLLALVICIVYIISYRKYVSRQKRNAIIFMLFGLFTAGVFQIFNTYLLLISFTMSAAMVYMYMCLENPDEYVDRVLKVFNVSAARAMLGNEWDNRKDLNLISVKIQGMKFINDTFGVKNGTDLLSSVADFLDTIPDAFFFRSGGATFTLAVFDSPENCHSIIKQIEERFQYAFHIADIDTLLNAKICVFQAMDDSLTFDQKLELIKKLMNDASDKNTDKVIVINHNTISEQKKMDEMESALISALENDGVIVYYQPIYNNLKRRFTSAEALMRIKDSAGNFIPPDVFIPFAEKNGLIIKLGMRMFEKVCQFIHDNDLQNSSLEYIEVNLSVIQCMQHDLADRLLEVMKRYNINPSFINFEITETAASNSENTLLHNMKKLMDKQATFSLDDYGSGYANINYILDLPISLLKYDKNMLWSYFDNAKGQLIMEHTVDMVKGLHLRSLAEGVETKEQFDKVQEMGIEYTQGFYFSKPLPEQDFLKKINI
ncbi:MAG: EAL domain-containing protein [Lachnospiraceae bacterium]|nr:EAL domain-containing protein [Lachnospiraceae bacterium]